MLIRIQNSPFFGETQVFFAPLFESHVALFCRVWRLRFPNRLLWLTLSENHILPCLTDDAFSHTMPHPNLTPTPIAPYDTSCEHQQARETCAVYNWRVYGLEGFRNGERPTMAFMVGPHHDKAILRRFKAYAFCASHAHVQHRIDLFDNGHAMKQITSSERPGWALSFHV